jgi:hypothetical protein
MGNWAWRCPCIDSQLSSTEHENREHFKFEAVSSVHSMPDKAAKARKKNYLCDHVHFMLCTVFWENLCGNKFPFIYLLIYV